MNQVLLAFCFSFLGSSVSKMVVPIKVVRFDVAAKGYENIYFSCCKSSQTTKYVLEYVITLCLLHLILSLSVNFEN